jgi:hypothetical protein
MVIGHIQEIIAIGCRPCLVFGMPDTAGVVVNFVSDQLKGEAQVDFVVVFQQPFIRRAIVYNDKLDIFVLVTIYQ